MKKKRRSWHPNYDADRVSVAHETRAEINATTLPIDLDDSADTLRYDLSSNWDQLIAAPIQRAGMTPQLVRHIL